MLDQFKNRLPLSEAQWNDYSNCFRRMVVPAKTVLLQEGAVSRKLFLVEQGCIRAWFNHDGKDITFQFFLEQSTVASMESFRKSRPSLVSLETIEPSVLWWINKKDADRMVRELSAQEVLRERFVDAIFERSFDHMAHLLSFIRDTPAQRYEALIRERPQLLQRIPQHYIASYLGVSAVHLSRIKSRLAKNKPRFI